MTCKRKKGNDEIDNWLPTSLERMSEEERQEFLSRYGRANYSINLKHLGLKLEKRKQEIPDEDAPTDE